MKFWRRPPAAAAQTGRARLRRPTLRWCAHGFTLLELAVILFIIGLMITVVLPNTGGYRKAELRSSARRLAGRVSYLYDQAESQKVVLRLIFDLDHNSYAVARFDLYSANPQFVADNSMGGKPFTFPPATALRDVTVADLGTFNAGLVATQFYPEGYVDATLVHLADASGDVMTLTINPMTGQVLIRAGDFTLEQMLSQ
jgi:general secretion pathway protein H